MSRTQGQLSPAQSAPQEPERPPAAPHGVGQRHATLGNKPSRVRSLTNSLFAAFKARTKLLQPESST